MKPSIAAAIGMIAAGTILLFAHGHAAMADEPAWDALKSGGHVVLMRHTRPEQQGAGKGNSLVRDASCVMERNLSSLGKQDAAVVGKAFKTRGIPVGEVLASPYCRTRETALIAFGSPTPSEFLSLSEVLPPAEAERNTAEAMKRIGEYRGAANLILVTHEPNIAAISFELVEQGAFLVLKPNGGSTFDLVGKIRLNEGGD